MGEWAFIGKEGARFEMAHWLACISREEGGLTKINVVGVWW